MRKAILLGLLIGFISFCGGPKTFELSEVDIVDLGTKVNSDNLTVRGVNVNMKVSKALKVLKKDGSYIKSAPLGGDTYFLLTEPGIRIDIKDDLETIERILIFKDFKGLKGKTQLFYVLQTKEAVEKFLRKHIGEPQEIIDKSFPGLGTGFEYVYPGGLFIGSQKKIVLLRIHIIRY
jgi:hypothetical protein